MMHWMRSATAVVGALLTFLSASPSWALTPTLIWQASGGYPAGFSADGTSFYMGTSSGWTSTGFQMRRATDGLVQKTITLPVASQLYDKAAFSPDKQFVAVSFVDATNVVKIEIYSLSTGSLVRTISTDAVRNIRGMDFSPDSSLLATMDRAAYGGGGVLRVFRTSDGSVVTKQGPFITNSNAFVKFSPGGTYLAFYENSGTTGFNFFRTSNWTSAQTMTQGNQFFIQWVGNDTTGSVWLRGNFSISVPYRRISVPGGTVQTTLSFDDSTRYVSAVTSNSKYLLSYIFANSDPSSPPANNIAFLRTTDGVAQVSYTLSSTTVSSGTINPAGTNFSYGICSDTGACSTYIAQMPSLP
ncbi:MAG TPA: hypothetical protein VGL13_05855 [Polyangiaceae bacterium]|jgi:hypothetical protein